MTILDTQVRSHLEDAYKQFQSASSNDEKEMAVIKLHSALERALRSYLWSNGVSEVEHDQINFPNLVDMVRDNTDLFASDPGVVSLLVSLNTTRNNIAHITGEKPSPQEINRDAKQLAKLIRRYWHSFFKEDFPRSLEQAKPKAERFSPKERTSPKTEHSSPITEPSSREKTETSQPRKKTIVFERIKAWFSRIKAWLSRRPMILRVLLKKLWVDEYDRKLRKLKLIRRLVTACLLFVLSSWLNAASLFTARWPQPDKYEAVALFILAAGVFIWGCFTLWKVLDQLRLKRVLILFAVGYVLYVAAVFLTSDGKFNIQQFLAANQRLFNASVEVVKRTSLVVHDAPTQFRSQYSGHSTPNKLEYFDSIDPSYLTPIPANLEAEKLMPTDQVDRVDIIEDDLLATPESPAPSHEFDHSGTSFVDAPVFSVGYLDNGDLMVTISVPGGITGSYHGMVDEEVFECTMLDAYPERLYCYGTGFGVGEKKNIQIYDMSTNEIVCQSEFTIPAATP